MAWSREQAFDVVNNRLPRKFDFPTDEKGVRLQVSDIFGSNTFTLHDMQKKLPKEAYHKLLQTIQTGNKLEQEVANALAHAIKEWALKKGATHFCHWFQPQTGSTAEKHDAFITFDDRGSVIEKFSGSQLIQSEPDASSFPSGGMRTTFEARGYTAWDPTSPVFILDTINGKTLCIPSVFISYHGDALDEKTPLLRSMEVLNQSALDLLHTIGYKKAKKVTSTLGAEQEYFLVDRAYFNSRPDLIMTGRTLLGSQPPRGQQLEDHYFGSVPTRVLAFMNEVEYELFKVGIPAKTRHNEVAPSQFEVAPIFEESNVACDHNQLLMEIMRKVSERHNFAILFHEKPFAGVNGSGKHNNWSMSVSGDDIEDPNLLEPGKTPHQNLRFLVVLASILKAVHRHAGLMRAAIASPGNDHRLGANEAPPAIISVFLGDLLNSIVQKIETGNNLEQNPEAAMISLGVSKIPTVSKDNTDRNRTSPFAFTGNKFEFRAVGASMSCSFPVTVLNTAVAEAMSEMTESIKAKAAKAKSLDGAIMEAIKEAFQESRAIRFEGNNYAQEWVQEAQGRGLPNFRKAPEAIDALLSDQARALFAKTEVLSEAELHSRFHVMVERYVKKLSIEVEALGMLIDTYVIPSATKEQTQLAASLSALSVALKSVDTSEQASRLKQVHELLNSMIVARRRLKDCMTKINSLSNERERATLLAQDAATLMSEVRSYADQLEDIVADEFWSLPKYREMLFIN